VANVGELHLSSLYWVLLKLIVANASVVMLNVIKLSVTLLSVVAPKKICSFS
jgi:hypothetical protein